MSSAGLEVSDDEKIAKSEQTMHTDDEKQSNLSENKNESDEVSKNNDNLNDEFKDQDKSQDKIDDPNMPDDKTDDKSDIIEKDFDQSDKSKEDSDRNNNENDKDEKLNDKENSGDQSEDIDKVKYLNITSESETKENNKNEIDSYQTTDGFISATESLENNDSSHPISESSNNDKNQSQDENQKDNDNQPLIQQTNTIIKAILGIDNSENDDKEVTKVENTEKDIKEDDNENQSDNQEIVNKEETKEENTESDIKEDQNKKEDDSENQSDNQEVVNKEATKEENSEIDIKEDQNQKEDDNENQSDNQEDSNKEDNDNSPRSIQETNDDDLSSSHQLSNILNSMTEKLQTDTVQITDAFSQTDPVPISVSCQTSFPPSETESESETKTKAREFQSQDRDNLFASFNCRCTQTRKLDKSFSRSNDSGTRPNNYYLRPRKISQAAKSKPTSKANSNTLLHLQISQPISPIQYLSAANSDLSSNTASPRSEASTISSTADTKTKNRKPAKNALPIINSKIATSNTARPRMIHSSFSSSSGAEPTKTPNIKTGKLSMIKKGTSPTSKSCVLKRNINVSQSTIKTVFQPTSSNNKNKLKDDVLNDTVHAMTNELLNDQSASDESLNKEKVQGTSSNEISSHDEKPNARPNRKASTENKQKQTKDLDEQITALTANLLPGSFSSSTQNSSNGKKAQSNTSTTNNKSKTTPKNSTSNSTQNKKSPMNSSTKPTSSATIKTTPKTTKEEEKEGGGTSQTNNDNNLSSSSYKKTKIEEEEELSSDDPDAPRIIKKRDYQGNTTEINFTDTESHQSSSKPQEDDIKINDNEITDDFDADETKKDNSSSVSTTQEAAADDESCNPDYEQMIDDLLSNIYPSPEDTAPLFTYIKRRELDSIIREDYQSCDRFHQAATLLVSSRNRQRFISDHYTMIENRLAKAESDLDSIEQLHRDRLDSFESKRSSLQQDLHDRQQEEVNNFESWWSSSRALVPFEKSSSGLLDLRFKQKQSALIKEFTTANSMKQIADSLQLVEEDDALVSAEASMKTAYSQLIEKHNSQNKAFEQKMNRHRQFLQAEADSEIAKQKLIIQQLEAKRDEKYDARARNNALSEMGFLSDPVSPRTFETFTNYRKDSTASKLRLNSTTIVQTLHQKKQTKRPFTPGKTKRYGGYC